MKSMKNWRKVFLFTFRNQAGTKSFRVTTVLIALLLLIGIPAVMAIVEKTGEDGSGVSVSPAARVIIVDEADMGEAVAESLRTAGNAAFAHIEYAFAPDVASANAEANAETLILDLRARDGAYQLTTLRADGTALSEDDAGAFSAFVNERFGYALFTQSGLTEEALMEMSVPTLTNVVSIAPVSEGDDPLPDGGEETNAADPYAPVREALSFAIPYVVIMTLYFLILAYGQGVANSAIMEKTSKLMDTFLVSIRPAAMILGKVLAIASAAIMQVAVWAAAIAGGFAIGVWAVRLINPDSNMLIVSLLENLGAATGLFTAGGVVMSLFLVVAGFLLYCSLSAVGASLASKPEDLSSTNMLFSLALVASFLATMFTGALYGEGGPLMNYIPFTAILIAPGRLLLGDMNLLEGALSLGIVLLTMLFLTLLAGKMYTMMSFWKGNPPTLKTAFGMLRGTKGKKA